MLQTVDDINTYLDEPPILEIVLCGMGGPMQYWYQAAVTRPRLAKMGSDFCSAPGKSGLTLLSLLLMNEHVYVTASSVDGERAFSYGRLQVNHLQHNMNSQTFKAQMTVGSWASTPLYPGLETVTRIIEKRMGNGNDEMELDVLDLEGL